MGVKNAKVLGRFPLYSYGAIHQWCAPLSQIGHTYFQIWLSKVSLYFIVFAKYIDKIDEENCENVLININFLALFYQNCLNEHSYYLCPTEFWSETCVSMVQNINRKITCLLICIFAQLIIYNKYADYEGGLIFY